MMNTTLFDNIQLYLQYKQLQTEKRFSFSFFSSFFSFLSFLIYCSRIQIYCLSDLHIDYKDNFDWINQLKCYFNENIFSILICSGDVSHEIKLLSEIFHILKTKFNEVSSILSLFFYLFHYSLSFLSSFIIILLPLILLLLI